jgi:MFS family permease
VDATSDRVFERNALLLWSGQFVSVTGDAVFIPCIAWLAQSVTGGGMPVGLAVGLATVPYLLFGPLVGPWVDRADRRRIMVASDLLRAALLVAFPFAVAALGGVSLAGIAAVAFLLGAFSTPFLPARDALLPEIVGGRSLPRWNALFQTSGQVATIVGLALGGFLLDAWGRGGGVDAVLGVLRLDGLTLLASAAALSFLVLPPRRRPEGPPRRYFADVKDGALYAAKDPVVRGLLVLTALDNLAIMGPAIVGATLLVGQTFALGPGDLARFEGFMAAGMLLGSATIATLGKRWPLGRLALLGMVMDGLTYLPLAWIEDFPLALAAMVLHGFFIPFIVVGRTSILQLHVPPGRRGNVFALVGVTVAGMTALSAVASGAIAEATSPRSLFLLAGVFGALCGLVGFLWIGGRLATPSPVPAASNSRPPT